MKRLIIASMLILLVLPVVAFAQGSAVPSLTVSEVRFATGGTGPYVIMVRPDGQGPPLTQARDLSGNPVDASVEIFVLSEDGTPWAQYPWQDVSVANSPETAPFPCGGPTGSPYGAYGFTMDENADRDGRLVFSNPPACGGWSDNDAVGKISSDNIQGEPLQLRWNSPDINGDHRVDLSDAGVFTGDMAAGYHFRSDLVYDGILNLSDVGEMANSLGTECQ